MSYHDIRIEVMSNLLEDLQIKATPEQIEGLVKDFVLHMEMERELESYQHISHKDPECKKCKRLEGEIKDLSEQIDIYQEGVRRRRGATHVYVDKLTRTVMYDLK